MAETSNKGLIAAVITGVLAIAGTVIGTIVKGISEINLEKTRLESQLILNALSVDSETQRRASLQFLVDSQLVRDEATRQGLTAYLDGTDRKQLPQFMPILQSGETQVLSPRTKVNMQLTDVDLFVCSKDKTNQALYQSMMAASESLQKTGRFGESKFKIWEGDLYNELPLEKLAGKTTIIIDLDHPEASEKNTILTALSKVDNIPQMIVVDNAGEQTEWRISIVFCSK